MLTIILLFLPNLLIAIFTTVGRKNYRALLQHPSLLLLPTFSMFSYQKIRARAGCCGDTDGKIMFSKKMSMCNIRVSGISLVVIIGLQMRILLLALVLPLLLASIIFSLTFMFMEECCDGCCLTVACCNITDQERIYDSAMEDVQDQNAIEME